MLTKLLKHEFRATGRIMLPMYLLLLLTAVGANLTTRGLLDTPYWVLDFLGVMLILAFTFAIIGVCAVAFWLMIQRFYKNLLQEEGYVMMTLPVSVHQHVWAKLIVSIVWFILTFLAILAACMVMAYDVGLLREFGHVLGEIWEGFRRLDAGEAVNSTVILVEAFVFLFLGMAAFALQFYAALAVGHSFANHKLLTSVGCFVGFQVVMQFLMVALAITTDKTGILRFLDRWEPSTIVAAHAVMLILIAATVIYGGIFYCITTFFLKRRLNLE